MLKRFVRAPESVALLREIDERTAQNDVFVSSWLLHTELHCGLARRASDANHNEIDRVLASLDLVDVQRRDLTAAAATRYRLRPADAIHLVTALRVEAEAMLVYDAELAVAAAAAGVAVLSPA